MNKVICSQLEYIRYNQIAFINNSTMILEDNQVMKKLMLESKAEYTVETETTSAGVIVNHSVTAKVRNDSAKELISMPLIYYVLKLRTDSEEFFVGTPDYPAELTYTHDNIYVNLTFKASLPL